MTDQIPARLVHARHMRTAEIFPQLRLLRNFRIRPFTNFSNAGVHLPQRESFYGLALPLGGAEISMQDLIRLYAALAKNGDLRPLRYTNSKLGFKNLTALSRQVGAGMPEQTDTARRRILSPEAAFLTLDMLGHVPRPELNCTDGVNSAPVFWKTGTSHGFRDAWSIGVFDHYVLAVWIGNFDGRANATFVGGTAAALLFFQIIDSLRANFVAADVVRGLRSATPATAANLKRVEFLRGLWQSAKRVLP